MTDRRWTDFCLEIVSSLFGVLGLILKWFPVPVCLFLLGMGLVGMAITCFPIWAIYCRMRREKMKQFLHQISISDEIPKPTQWLIIIGLVISSAVARWQGSGFWTYFLGVLALLALIYTIATK